jgi:hypothetical protein
MQRPDGDAAAARQHGDRVAGEIGLQVALLGRPELRVDVRQVVAGELGEAEGDASDAGGDDGAPDIRRAVIDDTWIADRRLAEDQLAGAPAKLVPRRFRDSGDFDGFVGLQAWREALEERREDLVALP